MPGPLGCRWPHSCSFPAPICSTLAASAVVLLPRRLSAPGPTGLHRCSGWRRPPVSDSPPTYSQSVQFSSVAQSCPTLCDPMDCSTPVLLVHHQLPEFTQTHVHWDSDAIQPSHPLSFPAPPAYLWSIGFPFCVQVWFISSVEQSALMSRAVFCTHITPCTFPAAKAPVSLSFALAYLMLWGIFSVVLGHSW